MATETKTPVTLPAQLKRYSTLHGLAAVWRKIRESVVDGMLAGLPKFASRTAQTLWAIEPLDIERAIRGGDPAFFVAIELRLAQLDCAMVQAKRSLADRSPLLWAKSAVAGFRDVAEQNLRKHGGTWPPTA